MNLYDRLRNKAIGFFDGSDPRNNVVSLIQRHVVERPDETAFRWPVREKLPKWGDMVVTDIAHQKMTFKQFFNLVCLAAAGLKKIGIGRGDRVIISLPMSIPLYQTVAAVQMIGASVVFLDSWASRDQLSLSAEIADAKAMISFEQAFELCRGSEPMNRIPIKVVVGPHHGKYTATLDSLQKNEPSTQIEAVRGAETALITFTNGSSGRPRGADRTHEFLAAQHYALHDCIPYDRYDLDLPAYPVFSLNNLAEGVMTVIPVIDVGRPSDKDSLMLASQIISLGITCATLSPSMLVGLAGFCAQNSVIMPKVKRLVTGGAPISNETLASMKKAVPNARIWVLYGSTEVEPIAHIEADEILNSKHSGSEGVCVGHFAEGIESRFIKIRKDGIRLVNDDWSQLEVAKSEVGELVVAGLQVCKNYYNDPEAIESAKIIESNGKVWHRTGDLACLDKDHNVWLVGRVHDAIARGSRMLFPAKVEMLMKKIEGVKQSAFLGVPDSELGEKAYALVELLAEARPRQSEILNRIACELKAEKVPFDHLNIVDRIPMDPRHQNKVVYATLRDQLFKK